MSGEKIRVYVPRDAAALAVGADKVAIALAGAAGDTVEIVRNGSRGLLWLEPMIEVATPEGRIAYGPVKAKDVEGLLAAGLLQGGDHPLRLGKPEEIPYLARQSRLTFERCGIIDPIDIADYRAHGGFVGLRNALEMSDEDITETVTKSGLRGRGGAGFPTGIKWTTVRKAQADQKVHRLQRRRGRQRHLRRPDDHGGRPLRAHRGHDDRRDRRRCDRGLHLHPFRVSARLPHDAEGDRDRHRRRRAGRQRARLGKPFRLHARLGAGAYICGEETSLLESLEGRRGVVRAKPPIPALKGLFGKPTVCNNVISLCSVPWIMAHGGQAYADYGFGKSRGTLCIQLGGNIKRGGLIEVGFGATLGEIVDEWGGGTVTGRPVRAAMVGGPLGAYFPTSLFDTPLDYESFAAKAGLVGHGGIVVFDDTVDMAAQARFAFEFCEAESCGKCTPCRIGATRGRETMDKVIAGIDLDKNLSLVEELCVTMTDASLCAMGGLTPVPVKSAMTHFPEDFVPAHQRQAAE